MKRILQQVITSPDSVFPKLNDYLTEMDLSELVSILDNVNENALYRSYFHGLHHSQKVCLFAYLIAKKLNVNEIDMQILMDAALYHDIGRMNEVEDSFHGYCAARKIDTVVKNPIYEDESNLVYLKAICDAHSLDDNKIPKIFQNYKYEYADLDYQRFNMLCTILKDADALDRARFKKTCNAALKEKFLRLDYSKSLVEFANLINSHYAFKVSEQDYESYKGSFENKEARCACLHGIGFDFFKLESILNSGILSSFQATRDNVDIVRNFNGNNKNIWISVVDADSIKRDGKAYNNFIKQGISFFAFTPELVKGSTKDKNSSYNAACDSGEYEDESFVFNKIPTENIYSLIVFKENWNKNIDELFYLYGANNYDIIYDKVLNYIVSIKMHSGIDVDIERAEALLQACRKKVVEFEKKSEEEQKATLSIYLEELDEVIDKINQEIQKWFLQHFKKLLHADRNDIKLSEVISYILKTKKIRIENVYDAEDEIMFVLNPLLVKEEQNKTLK